MADGTVGFGGVPGVTGDTSGNALIPGATSGQDWGSLIASLIGGGRALTGATSINPQPFMDRADPYGPSRSQWWPQIQSLMADPTSVLQDPSFTKPLQLGGEAIARQFGSQGMGISGNEDAALQDYGQTQGMNFIQQRLNNLINLGGVNAGSPAAAGQIGAGLTQQNQAARTQGLAGLSGPIGALLSSLFGPAAGALGGLGSAIGNLFSGGGGTNFDIGGPNSDLTGNLGIDTGGQAGSLLDFNTGVGDISGGDQNIINDIFSGGQIPDLSQLFAGL